MTCYATLSIIVASFFFVLVCSCSSKLESFYPSFSDAKKDGAVDRGWIPAYLPSTSRNIYETHRIDDPRVWCAFEFSAADSASLQNKLKEFSAGLSAIPEIPNPSVSWWPDYLVGHIDPNKVRANKFQLYLVAEASNIPAFPQRRYFYLFAIDWAAGRAFFFESSTS
jgi:hypothetical protein